MTDTLISTESARTPLALPARRAMPWWAQIAVLLVVFTAGGAVGAMVATKFIHSRMEYYRHHAEALPQDILPRLRQRLALTDGQFDRVREIVNRRHPIMIESRRQLVQTIVNEFRAMEDEIDSVLDAHQQTIWRDIAASVSDRFLPSAPDGGNP